MSSQPWHKNTAVFALVCLLIPPLGIVLLWLRPGGIFSRLTVTGALLALTFVQLFTFYGMRTELDGSGRWPIGFTFASPESHYETLERVRAEAKAAAPLESPLETVERTEVANLDVPEPVSPAEPATEQTSSPLPPATIYDAYWTDYRGPNRDGHYAATPIRADWPADGLPELWRQTIGGGYASVVIADGRVFTIEQRRQDEVVAAYDFETGRELWTRAWPGLFQEPMGGDGPRATPTWNEGKIYALGAEGELQCLDAATGKLIWRKNILADHDAPNLQWAMSAAPLVVDDKLIVLPGGRSGNSIAAYDKETGALLWTSLDDRAAYVSPMLATLAGRRQVVVLTATRIVSVAPEDGSLLWEHPWATHQGINSSQPLVLDENHLFVSSGYGQGAVLLRISAEGSGLQSEEVWANNSLRAKFNSPVLHEGLIYGLDEGILVCLDPRTGQRKWKGGRYGFGQVLLASGHLIVLTEQGDVVLVRATPESHQEVTRFSALRGKTWNNPAIAKGRLIVRNQTEMASYDLRVP